MVSAKNLMKYSKADVGWDTKHADYTSCGNAVKEFCPTNSISIWGGDRKGKKNDMIPAARMMTGFRPAIRARLASGSEFQQKAVEVLRQACGKRKAPSAENLAMQRGMWMPHVEDDDDDGDDDKSDAVQVVGNSGPIWLTNPTVATNPDANNDCSWHVGAKRKYSVIDVRTLDGIWDVVKAHMPPERNIGEMFVGFENPRSAATTIPGDWYRLRSDVAGFAFTQ